VCGSRSMSSERPVLTRAVEASMVGLGSVGISRTMWRLRPSRPLLKAMSADCVLTDMTIRRTLGPMIWDASEVRFLCNPDLPACHQWSDLARQRARNSLHLSADDGHMFPQIGIIVLLGDHSRICVGAKLRGWRLCRT